MNQGSSSLNQCGFLKINSLQYESRRFITKSMRFLKNQLVKKAMRFLRKSKLFQAILHTSIHMIIWICIDTIINAVQFVNQLDHLDFNAKPLCQICSVRTVLDVHVVSCPDHASFVRVHVSVWARD